jgi:hypothetical protein
VYVRVLLVSGGARRGAGHAVRGAVRACQRPVGGWHGTNRLVCRPLCVVTYIVVDHSSSTTSTITHRSRGCCMQGYAVLAYHHSSSTTCTITHHSRGCCMQGYAVLAYHHILYHMHHHSSLPWMLHAGLCCAGLPPLISI